MTIEQMLLWGFVMGNMQGGIGNLIVNPVEGHSEAKKTGGLDRGPFER